MLTDFRLAVRSLLKAPAFTLTAALTLALGIGANTAIFSIVYAVLLKPLPFAAPDRLVSMTTMRQDSGLRVGVTQLEYEQWRGAAQAVARSGIYRDTEQTVSGHGEPELTQVAIVSDGFFTTLGTSPVIGRALGPDNATQPVVVLGHDLWRRRFAAGEHALGATLTLNGRPHTVVGVMPPAFAFPSKDIALWVPRLSVPAEAENPRYWQYQVIGRLKTAAAVEQARAEAATIGRRISPPRRGPGALQTQVRSLEEDIVGDVRSALLLLFAVVGVVLLVACIDVGSLCLARAAVRQGEIAVRTALGASRWPLLRYLLAEAALIGAAGALAGGLMAAWLPAAGVRLVAPDTPRLGEVAVSLPVLVFTAAIGVVSVLLVGLLPAWRACHVPPGQLISLNGRGTGQTTRARGSRFALITAETALSTVVLVAALLFSRSMGALLDVESGRPADNILTVGLKLPVDAYPVGSPVAGRFVQEASARVKRLPGVQSVAVTTSLPPNVQTMGFEGQARNLATGRNEPYYYNLVIAGGDYFRTLGISCLRGRLFDERDTLGAPPVAIISRDLARRQFGREDALGQALALPGKPPTIVGVVDDVRYGGLDKPTGGAMYLPYAQAANPAMYLVVRTAGSPWSIAQQVRDAVRRIDGRVPIGRPATLRNLRHASVAQPESRAVLLRCLGVLALALASVGLYGNSTYAASQRTVEVGLRMALGADRRSVFRMLLRGGLMPVALGLVIGLGGAASLTRFMASLLFGVRPLDPVTFAAVPGLLLVVAAVAISLPAWRAATADPATTLRRTQ